MAGVRSAGTGYGRSYPIVVAPSDPAWPSRFEDEARRIRKALRAIALRVEHIGSTAVPGLPAKPVIDLQVSVEAVEPVAPYGPALEGLGYRTHGPDAPDHAFFKRDVGGRRAFHVHVVRAGSDWELRHLEFRDALRADARLRREYAELKKDLAARFPMDIDAYLDGKEGMIRAVEARLRAARAAARP